jgi:hypothetical protein
MEMLLISCTRNTKWLLKIITQSVIIENYLLRRAKLNKNRPSPVKGPLCQNQNIAWKADRIINDLSGSKMCVVFGV